MEESDTNTNSEDIVEIKRVGSSIEELMENNEPIKLNVKHRRLIFILMGLVYCFSSSDGGIIPQQNKNIQYNFEDKGEARVGLFSSIDYVGRIMGAGVMSVLIDRLDRQIFFSGCCILKAITLFVSAITGNYYINLISRLVSGIPQTLLTSYGTIWTDQFGRRKRRSLMLSLFQLFSLLGIIVGYGIGMICNAIISVPEEVDSYGTENDPYEYKYFYLGWRLAFSIEGIILAILGVIFFFCPKIFFSSTFYLNDDNDKEGDDNIGRIKSLKEIKEEKEKEKNKKYNLLKQLPRILCNKLYIFMSIGNTVAFFGMRVIQFYADKYMELVLDVDKNVKFVYYIVLCLTGPILGIVIVGLIMQKIGGYGSRNGMIFILVLNTVAAFDSLLYSATLNTFLSLFSAWFYLFCLAAVTPLQGGVVISSLPKELRGNGYSINMFFLNALGSFPSSYVFALVCDFVRDHFDDSNMRYRTSMRYVMLYNFVGLLLIICAAIFRFRIKGDLGVDKKEEEKLGENSKENKEENNDKNNSEKDEKNQNNNDEENHEENTDEKKEVFLEHVENE